MHKSMIIIIQYELGVLFINYFGSIQMPMGLGISICGKCRMAEGISLYEWPIIVRGWSSLVRLFRFMVLRR